MFRIWHISVLTLLGGACTCALAQSSMTLYGVIDTAVVHTRNGPNRINSVDSGVMLGSRLGFRGTEGLGGGRQALYVLEMGLNNDTGAAGQSGLGFGRQVFVGLSDPELGRVTMGRHYSVLHTTLSAYTEGTLIWGHAMNYFRDGSVLRLGNSIRYESPNWSGLSVKLLKAFGEQGGSSGNVVNPSFDYRNGPWQVGASLMKRNKTSTNQERYVTAGGSHDFGWASTSLVYYTLRDDLPAATSLNRNAFEISATVPVGTNVLYLAYGEVEGKARANTGASSLSARFDYVLSRRTRIYTGYSFVLNDGAASFTINSASNAGPIVAAGDRISQVVVGVTHTF